MLGGRHEGTTERCPRDVSSTPFGAAAPAAAQGGFQLCHAAQVREDRVKFWKELLHLPNQKETDPPKPEAIKNPEALEITLRLFNGRAPR